MGQRTVIRGDSVRTGATAVLPHDGNLFQDKVRGAVIVFNGFGKLVGSTQVEELDVIETPIILTNTLAVWDAAIGDSGRKPLSAGPTTEVVGYFVSDTGLNSYAVH